MEKDPKQYDNLFDESASDDSLKGLKGKVEGETRRNR